MKQAKNWTIVFLINSLTLVLSGCASVNTPQEQKQEMIDPYESVNRAIFKFNTKADKYVIKPVAITYSKALPDTIQSRVTHFFDNLRDVTTSANDLLQGKFGQFAHDASRFVINSTIGILGTFDPASHLGLERHKEDFGQTLAVWGYENSAYLVLPILGPCTVRDTAGLAVDYYALSVWPLVESDKAKYALVGLDLLDIRAQMLKTEDVVKAIAVDEYVFNRDAYLQRRKFLITDGETPENLTENLSDKASENTNATPSTDINTTTVPEANTDTKSQSNSFPGEDDNQEIVK
jgi:phospholipid-binding lipoprotein MlaA